MTQEEIDFLKKIPIKELRYYINIRDRKHDYVKKQMFEEAARLRDEERFFVKKYISYEKILSSITIQSLRDILVDEIIN